MSEIEINIGRTIADVKRGFGQVSKENITKAASSAINRAVSSARATGAKEIIKIYNIDKEALKERAPSRKSNAIILWKSNKTSLTGKIIAYGAPIPLIDFPTEQTASGINLTVKKGQTKVMPGAFYSISKKGKQKVKAHGQYSKNQFLFDTGQKIITQIMTTSVRAAISQASVLTAMRLKANEQFRKRFTHDLERLIKSK